MKTVIQEICEGLIAFWIWLKTGCKTDTRIPDMPDWQPEQPNLNKIKFE